MRTNFSLPCNPAGISFSHAWPSTTGPQTTSPPADLVQALQPLIVAQPRVVQAVHGVPDLAVLLQQGLARGLRSKGLGHGACM